MRGLSLPRLAILAVVLGLLATAGVLTSRASHSSEEAAEAQGTRREPLATPSPIPADLAERLTSAALQAPGLPGAGAAARRTVLAPAKWWGATGPCIAENEPRCAAVAVYDYATDRGSLVILTLDDQPRLVAIRAVPGRAIPLSPEEGQQGFATAEGFP